VRSGKGERRGREGEGRGGARSERGTQGRRREVQAGSVRERGHHAESGTGTGRWELSGFGFWERTVQGLGWLGGYAWQCGL
jgi:hypothetical protein